MLPRKFSSYRLYMAGIAQTSRNALFSLQSLKAGKTLVRLDENKEKKEKKIGQKINIKKVNK